MGIKLYLHNVKKFYSKGQIKAVDIKKLSIKESHITCLIGPSGCGKSTTLKIINKLIEPDSGFVEINRIKSSQTKAVLWRRKIGYVIQEGGLLPHLTVMQNISLLSLVLKRDKEFTLKRGRELLELVGMDPDKYQNRYPTELSGGQRQRAGIARALMEDPPLLLMDEPFGSLDSITGTELRKEFIKLNRQLKKTILMVTHNLDEAFEMAGDIVLMRNGSIIQQGTKEDFKKNPVHPFVSKFLHGKI